MVCEKLVNRAKTVKKSIVLAHSKPQSGENDKIFTVLAQLTEILDFSRVKFEGFFLLLVKIN